MIEQLGFTIELSLAERYAAWRKTPAAVAFVAELERRILTASNAGVQRIEVNRYVADLRAELKIPVNNSFRSFLARELVARHPLELKHKIELRHQHPRKAA